MSSRSASQEAWSHHHLRRCISMPGALTKCHRPGGSEADPRDASSSSPAGGMSEVRCQGLPPPRSPSGASFPPLPALGGSLLAFLGGQLHPSSLCLRGLVALTPGVCVHSSLCLWGHRSWAQGPPVTSISCRDPISKQGHVHRF